MSFPSISPKQSFPALKKFDEWNEAKKTIHSRETIYLDDQGNKKSRVLFKEGEIWWVSMGQNIGSESHGKGEQFARPVYIFRKFSLEAFLGIPLTSQSKTGSWYHPIKISEMKQSHLILPQLRYFSANRLLSRLGDVPEPDEKEIEDAIKLFLRI